MYQLITIKVIYLSIVYFYLVKGRFIGCRKCAMHCIFMSTNYYTLIIYLYIRVIMQVSDHFAMLVKCDLRIIIYFDSVNLDELFKIWYMSQVSHK